VNIDKLIEVLEIKIASLISDEDISATKISTLSITLLKLYAYRDKK